MIERSLNENISRLEKDIKDIKDIGKDNRKTLEQNILSLQKDIERRLQTRCQKSDEDLEAVKAETLTAVSKLLPRKGLQHLDYHLTTHCNLNCKGCSVFSPIAKEWFAAPEEFKKEIEALRKALDGASPVNIHLLGGSRCCIRKSRALRSLRGTYSLRRVSILQPMVFSSGKCRKLFGKPCARRRSP